jgi:hypothetical protein
MKRFTLTLAEAQFLYNVLSNIPDKTFADTRKKNKIFDTLEPAVEELKELLKPLSEKSTLANEKMKEKVNQKDITPEERVKALTDYRDEDEKLNKEIKKIGEIKREFQCDRESLAYNKQIFEGFVENSYSEPKKGEKTETAHGIGARNDTKMFVAIIDAIEDAKEDSEKKN